jgi:hypothetical protein
LKAEDLSGIQILTARRPVILKSRPAVRKEDRVKTGTVLELLITP